MKILMAVSFLGKVRKLIKETTIENVRHFIFNAFLQFFIAAYHITFLYYLLFHFNLKFKMMKSFIF